MRVSGTREEAEAELARRYRDIWQGPRVDLGPISVGDYLTYWLRESAQPRLTQCSFRRYQEIVSKQLQPGLGAIALAELRVEHVVRYFEWAATEGRTRGNGGLSSHTLATIHSVLRSALDQAVRWQMLVSNPVDHVPSPRRRPHT
ncbi:MAG: hypothetical protein ACK47B_10700 [Armatimonadota bacterium]